MKILITGGFGFIGGAISNKLIKEGHEVKILDFMKMPPPLEMLITQASLELI